MLDVVVPLCSKSVSPILANYKTFLEGCIFFFFLEGLVWVFWSLQTNLLSIARELAEVGSVNVAVCVCDR